MNYTQTTQKLFKTKSFSKIKTFILLNFVFIDNFVQNKVFSRSQTPLFILTKRKQIKKLPKTYPPQDSPNNQKEQNHKETKNHMVPHEIPQ
jgi:hypothetical protein